MLESWRDTPTRATIGAFVETVVATVTPEERVAVFDNDGTLWCEKPLPIQADFILRRMKEQAEVDPALREQQPRSSARGGRAGRWSA
jgi:hypothetical protein